MFEIKPTTMHKISKPFNQNTLNIWREENDSTGMILAIDENKSFLPLNSMGGFRFEKLFPGTLYESVLCAKEFQNEEDAINYALENGWEVLWFDGRHEFTVWAFSQMGIDFDKNFC